MIDYKKECERLYKFLVAITIALVISLILFCMNFRATVKKDNEKNEKIWQLQTEVVELKEQLHILENVKED